MAQKRSEETGDLPPYLWVEKAPDYWRYAHPQYVAEHGRAKFFRAPREQAKELAKGANDQYELQAKDGFLNQQHKSRRKPGPKSKASFSTVCDDQFHYWAEESHDDPDRRPAESTVENSCRRRKLLKAWFEDTHINTIGVADMSEFYQTIDSTHEYQKITSIGIDIFKYAAAKGLYTQPMNPAREAALKRVPRDTERLSTEPAQYDAIYERAPEWMQIAMDIILQTSSRQSDVWSLRWTDIIDDVLYIIPQKSRTRKRGNFRASYLKFDLRRNAQLRQAIHRARQVKMRMQGLREAFKDCPYIVMRTDIKRVRTAQKTRDHALQLTKRYANGEMYKVRQQVIENTDLFDGYTDEQLPAYHGIRSLSLQLLEDSLEGTASTREIEDFLQQRAGHRDFKTTKDYYLTPNDPRWMDVTGGELSW